MKKLFTKRNLLSTLKIALPALILVFLVLIPAHNAYAVSPLISPLGWLLGDAATNAGVGTIRTAILWILQVLIYAVMTLTAMVLYICGLLMDHVFMFTIVGMKSKVDDLTAINVIWKLFRDLANMFFIFVLTYAGIATILGISGVKWQTYLKNIIIAGLLINFSLFITKVPIDISNVLSIQFYKAAVDAGGPGNGAGALAFTGGSLDFAQGTLSGAFMNYLRIQAFYKPETNMAGLDMVANLNSISELSTLLIKGLFGNVTMLIASCAFIAVAFMLLYRFFILIYVMVISPLYFLGKILPQAAGGYDQKWKQYLIEQCLFAPILFLLFWVILQFMRELQTITGVGASVDFSLDSIQKSFGAIASLIINYFFIIAMIIGALAAARQAGAKGGEFADKMAKKLGSVPGRMLAGSVGYSGRQITRGGAFLAEKSGVSGRVSRLAASDSKWAKATGAQALARGSQKVGGALVSSSFDMAHAAGPAGKDYLGEGVKGGYKDQLEARAKANREAKVALDERTRKDGRKKIKEAYQSAPEVANEMLAELDTRGSITLEDGRTVTGDRAKDEIEKMVETATKNYKDEIEKMRSAELAKLRASEIMGIHKLLTQKQVDELLGDKSHLTDAEKDTLKKARKDMLTEELNTFKKKKTEATTEDEIRALDRKFTQFINQTSSVHIAGADATAFLMDEEVLKRLDGEDVKKLAEKAITKEIVAGESFYETLEKRIRSMEDRGIETRAANYLASKDVAGVFTHDPAELRTKLDTFRHENAKIERAAKKDGAVFGPLPSSASMPDGPEKKARAQAEAKFATEEKERENARLADEAAKKAEAEAKKKADASDPANAYN